ncbi:hypothetical protein [Candidatus Berkiella aquae]|uniref:Uncharacterized protein n=1 Tax=Candidatus Berkiella aquae TaxID=295108 RepID=A0A0Q9YP45_9GAMM|nr:hypothetical protein [Candidatus Berkiella aquae]MCS5712155.1 hypothetical protein [Candidatus Berkiella aquae]
MSTTGISQNSTILSPRDSHCHHKLPFYERLRHFIIPLQARASLYINQLNALFANLDVDTLRSPRDLTQLFVFAHIEIDLASIKSKQKQLLNIFSILFEIPAIKTIASQVFHGQPSKVLFVSDDELFSEGDCNYQSRIIRIASNISIYDIISTMLFEFCNAANTSLAVVSVKRFQTADDYALAMERAEYLTYNRHIHLLVILQRQESFVKVLETNGEDPDKIQREINRSYLSFSEYWRGANDSRIKGYSHSEYYRIHYRQLQELNHIFHKKDNKPSHSSQLIIHQPVMLTSNHEKKRLGLNDLFPIFSSTMAKDFLQAILKNANAIKILNSYQKSIAQHLAKHVTEKNLQKFKALNQASQAYFLSQYAILNSHLIEMPPKISAVKTTSSL